MALSRDPSGVEWSGTRRGERRRSGSGTGTGREDSVRATGCGNPGHIPTKLRPGYGFPIRPGTPVSGTGYNGRSMNAADDQAVRETLPTLCGRV